jgi:DNA-binding MarR family transcriptional regulator
MPNPERPAASNDDLDKVIRLTDRDVRDAARLFRLLAEAGSERAGPHRLPSRDGSERQADQLDSGELLARAKHILSSRRQRLRYFNPAIFGEPAWEILLVLYITDQAGGRQTLGKLADWIDTPLTSVLRWVSYLEKEKFLERRQHPTDRRTTFLQLLDRGRDAMTAYLKAIPS